MVCFSVRGNISKWSKYLLCVPVILTCVFLFSFGIVHFSDDPDISQVASIREQVKSDQPKSRDPDISQEVSIREQTKSDKPKSRDSDISQDVSIREQVKSDQPKSRDSKRQTLPGCVIIGVRKCGTRALLTFLDIHPDIQTAHEEVHFFDKEEEFKKGFEHYRKQMPLSSDGQLTLEKTPTYFTTASTPERMYQMNASVLLILVVRDPVTRVVSDYLHTKADRLKDGKAIGNLTETLLDDHGNVNEKSMIIIRSMYALHFRRWLKYFPLKQIHIVDGDALVDNPYKEIYAIENFLHLDHKIKADNFYFDIDKGFYCVNAVGSEPLCLPKSKGRAHPELEPMLQKKLTDFFKQRNKTFFQMVNRTFDW